MILSGIQNVANLFGSLLAASLVEYDGGGTVYIVVLVLILWTVLSIVFSKKEEGEKSSGCEIREAKKTFETLKKDREGKHALWLLIFMGCVHKSCISATEELVLVFCRRKPLFWTKSPSLNI